MKTKYLAAIWLILFAILIALSFVSVILDVFFNPWIKTVNHMAWWNFFTTSHYMTWLYLTSYGSFVMLVLILSAIEASIILLFATGKHKVVVRYLYE